jgi:cell fate regulator YaaT (PSP1 superfamily)
MIDIAGVRFKKACKVYKFNVNGLELKPGDMVVVEVEKGIGMGSVVTDVEQVDEKDIKGKLRKVVRKADKVDIERLDFNKERELEALELCKAKVEEYKLPMKLVRVEYLFDSSKVIFYFTSDERVDFRGLVKELAGSFFTRIEMRQIGVRDEAKIVGGLGPCGMELCCSNFLSDFQPVTVKMAKEQNITLNPLKISGVCGRLMCCLSFEHGMQKDDPEWIKERACGSACDEAKSTSEAPALGMALDGVGAAGSSSETSDKPERQVRQERQGRSSGKKGGGERERGSRRPRNRGGSKDRQASSRAVKDENRKDNDRGVSKLAGNSNEGEKGVKPREAGAGGASTGEGGSGTKRRRRRRRGRGRGAGGGQDRSGQDRSGQDRSGQGSTGGQGSSGGGSSSESSS